VTDRDLAAEFRVAGTIDLAHAAGAEGGDDLIRAKSSAGREAHSNIRAGRFCHEWRRDAWQESQWPNGRRSTYRENRNGATGHLACDQFHEHESARLESSTA